MNDQGQTICLNMIVKNETPVIRRCLDSLRGFIDHWVIVDTGSTDGTQAMIRAHLAGVPGELHERPWVDFAHNRSEALVLARGKADYVFLIDADEVLDRDEGFRLPALTADAYHLSIVSGGVSYFKTQLVRNAIDWCFKNVLHEYVYSPDARTEGQLSGLRTLRFPDGARARDPLTYRKDALVLERALLDEPDNSRYVFYLAQSYRDCNELELAIRNYQRRAKMGGWIEEVWYSLYQIAELKSRQGTSWAEVQEDYLRAFQLRPARMEPLYKIGVHHQAKRDFHLAQLFFGRAMRVPFPVDDRLFVEKNVYDYLLPIEYAVSSFYCGDHEEAIATNNRLLLERKLPAEVWEHVIRNRRYSLDARTPRRTTAAPTTSPSQRIVVCVVYRDAGPALDSCVESLLGQRHPDVRFFFVDDGSARDHAAKLPLDDRRATLVRQAAPRGFAAALELAAAEAAPDDLILALDGRNWLADDDALTVVDTFFREHSCDVMHGQFRFSSGHFGTAQPRPSADAVMPSLSPVVFRAKLLRAAIAGGRWPVGDGEEAVCAALLTTAGLARSGFNDRPIVVVNVEPSPPSQAQAQAVVAAMSA